MHEFSALTAKHDDPRAPISDPQDNLCQHPLTHSKLSLETNHAASDYRGGRNPTLRVCSGEVLQHLKAEHIVITFAQLLEAFDNPIAFCSSWLLRVSPFCQLR